MWQADTLYYAPVKQEIVDKLRATDKNKNFLIVKNTNFSKNLGKNLYYELDDIKLILDGGEKLFLKYKTPTAESRAIVKTENVINKSVLRKIVEDVSESVDFVENVSYLGWEAGKTLKDAVIHNNYYSLSSEAQLYYQLEGSRTDLI